MISESAAPLSTWESFYVIVGSSAAALTGLQFVVMALVADIRRKPSSEQIQAFGTPNIVHFTAVLILSAVLSAPWPVFTGVAWILALAGIAGIAYIIATAIRARRQHGYKPVFEDWLWHIILPFTSYAVLFVTAIMLGPDERDALFLVAAVTLLLLVIGIHNGWDTVTFLVIDSRSGREMHVDERDEQRPVTSEQGELPPLSADG